VPASFFVQLDPAAGDSPMSPTSAKPRPAPMQRTVTPPRTVSPPRTASPKTQPTPEGQEKKRLVLRRKSTVSKELVQQAQPQAPPQDDINALPTYDEIEPMTVATLKALFDEAEKRHAEEMASKSSCYCSTR